MFMVKMNIAMVGNRELGRKINSITKNLERETENTLNKMVYEGQLYGMAVAPRRTGATALNIKTAGSKNYRVLYITPTEKAYNIYIDRGTVPKSWGTKKASGMVDMRDRDDKLYYFVGNDSNEGKTLAFMKNNFGRHVSELGKQIAMA